MFLPLFYSFLGFLEFKNLVEPIFDMRGFTRKNFSSKFWFWEKMMAAPPRSKLVQKIWGCRHVQYLSKMLKIGFVFLGNRFRVKDLLLGTVIWLREFQNIRNTFNVPWHIISDPSDWDLFFPMKNMQFSICSKMLPPSWIFNLTRWVI